MSTLGPSPFLWLEFDEKGALRDPAVVQRLSDLLKADGIGDLVVLSHGWNNDKQLAERLYKKLWDSTLPNFPSGKAQRIVVAGVSWPALAYSTGFDAAALASVPAGGAASVGAGVGSSDLSAEAFDDALKSFVAFVGPAGAEAVAAAKAAVEDLSDTTAFDLVRKGAEAVGADASPPDTELAQDREPITNTLRNPPEALPLLVGLEAPPHLELTADVGAAQSFGSTIQGLFNGPRAAVARFLNLLTYWEMKTRAGAIGVGLADHVLAKLSPPRETKLHLVGHSFGGRLVTAAANRSRPAGTLKLFSLTLLQAAFSHNGLAKVVTPGVSGAFPDVVGKPDGPITVTHTHNDAAVTLYYAIASRLSRDTTQGIGDARDEFGAMGANGPQKLDPRDMEPDDTAQAFAPKRKKVNTVLADAFIVQTPDLDAHSNVANPECGRLLAATILA